MRVISIQTEAVHLRQLCCAISILTLLLSCCLSLHYSIPIPSITISVHAIAFRHASVIASQANHHRRHHHHHHQQQQQRPRNSVSILRRQSSARHLRVPDRHDVPHLSNLLRVRLQGISPEGALRCTQGTEEGRQSRSPSSRHDKSARVRENLPTLRAPWSRRHYPSQPAHRQSTSETLVPQPGPRALVNSSTPPSRRQHSLSSTRKQTTCPGQPAPTQSRPHP